MANIFVEAKRYQRKHPRIDWQECIQRVKKKTRRKGKKAKNRQTGTSNKPADQRRTAKKPGKRKSKSGSPYYERRKNRSDVPGQLTGMSAAKLSGELVRRYKEKINRTVVLKYNATKKPLKKRYQKIITSTKAALRRLQ
jgi:hypothetical protein